MKLTEQTLSSEIVYNGKVVKLRVDRVLLPNGRESLREVVAHRGAIAAVPLLQNNIVVMVRQYRQAAGQVLLEIPAGTLEKDEDPLECAQRELQEEINYFPTNLTLLFSSYLAPGYSSEMLYTYLAEGLVKKSAIADSDEFLEIVEIPLSEAVEMITAGEIKDAKSICGILMTERLIRQRSLME